MKVKTLNIENFCAIQKMKIDFHPYLNIFVGNNGVGKISILRALEFRGHLNSIQFNSIQFN